MRLIVSVCVAVIFAFLSPSPARADVSIIGTRSEGGHVVVGVDTVIVQTSRGGAVGYDGDGRKVSTGTSSGKTTSGKPVSCVGVFCRIGGAPAAGEPAPPQQTVSLEAIAISVATEIYLPALAPKFGPDPSVNEWKMLAVGYPVWLWTDVPASVHSSATQQGITVTLSARPTSTSFEMGDGATVRCVAMTPYTVAVKPGTPSPDCGYTYRRPSLPQGSYTVTAMTRWQVSWSAVGQSGTFAMNRAGSRQLPIGEIQAVINR